MNTKQHKDENASLAAFLVTLGMHLLIAGGAYIFMLDTPERADHPLVLTLSIPPDQVPRKPKPVQPEIHTTTTQVTVPVPAPQRIISLPRPASQPVTMVKPDVLRDTSRTTLRNRFTRDKLTEISEEEAFTELMSLLEEYPEFKDLILGKMVAGKSMPESPDYFVSLGIRDAVEHLDVKTKYEYEAARQTFLYGAYNDPVNGPRGYQKTGVQVNSIELLCWLIELIGGKKK